MSHWIVKHPALLYRASIALLTLYLALVAIGAWQKPMYNWDLVGYIGCVYSIENTDITAIHARTLALLRQEIPYDQYISLTGKESDYRRDVASNPRHFAQQLPFYWVKPLYVYFLYALSKAGANIVAASMLISITSTIVFSLIFLHWLRRYVNRWLIPLLTILVLAAAGIIDVARLSTPDALFAAISIAGLYLVFERKAVLSGLLVLFVTVGVRPDGSILLLLLLAFLAFVRPHDLKISRMATIGFAVIVLAVTLWIEYQAGYYGWTTHYYHSFILNLTAPAEMRVHVGVLQYLIHTVHGMALIPPENTFASFVILGIASFFLGRHRTEFARRWKAPLILLGLSVLLHFAIYTVVETRFFVAQYLVTAMVFLSVVCTPSDYAEPPSSSPG